MENCWADPEGFAEPPQPVRYRILDRGQGEVVERMTQPERDPLSGRYHHALHPVDQPFADAVTEWIQRVCAYFYAPDAPLERPVVHYVGFGAPVQAVETVPAYEPIGGVPDVVLTDAEVAARIARLDAGENTREALRAGKGRYPLTELPFDQQRALIEQIEWLKQEWRFEILGAVPLVPPPTEEGPVSL